MSKTTSAIDCMIISPHMDDESLEACVAEGRRQCGDECHPDDADEQHELSDEEMQRLTFFDEDGSKRTFAEELARRIAAGEQFPQSFAAEDW